jgi:hypothetical protein
MIKNLTDREARFPRLGIIKKGEPKGASGIGKDLDYFRLDTKDENIKTSWVSAYGNTPNALDILLPFVTTEQSFPCWLEEWTAASLKRRCDGETIQLQLTSSNTYSKSPSPCLKDSSNPCNCKQVGRLSVILPKIKRMGYFEVQTHSIHDIISINEQLLAIEISAGTLQGIPLLLQRLPREISIPVKDKETQQTKKIRQIKNLLQIQIHPNIAGRVLDAIQSRAFATLEGSSPNPAQIKANDWHSKALIWAVEKGLNESAANKILANCQNDKQKFFEQAKSALASTEF